MEEMGKINIFTYQPERTPGPAVFIKVRNNMLSEETREDGRNLNQ